MATFVFTWDTGYVTEITVPNVVGDICDKRYNNTISKHSNAITQLLAGDDPTADENSVSYLTDKLAYIHKVRQVCITYIANTKGIQTFWQGKYNYCKGCCSVMFFGTCVASCCCHCQSWSKTCATGTGDLNHEKNSWWKAVDLWNTALAGSQSLLDATNLALDEANAQAITLQELLQLQAQTNEIIAETNIQITHAKSKEREEEEQGRISNFITIIIPIILILLTIGLIFVWKK